MTSIYWQWEERFKVCIMSHSEIASSTVLDWDWDLRHYSSSPTSFSRTLSSNCSFLSNSWASSARPRITRVCAWCAYMLCAYVETHSCSHHTREFNSRVSHICNTNIFFDGWEGNMAGYAWVCGYIFTRFNIFLWSLPCTFFQGNTVQLWSMAISSLSREHGRYITARTFIKCLSSLFVALGKDISHWKQSSWMWSNVSRW